MKLKEKFDKVLDPRAWNISEITPQEQCEEIADEFAIDFAKWCFTNFDMTTPMKELLEIYKKEKGL